MFGLFSDSAARPAGREHIPLYPNFFLFIRIAQLVVSVVVLGLDAYGLSILSFSGDELMIFTVIASIIVCIYVLVATLAAPAAYNYWAVLSLDIFLTIFWLISFALLASQVAPFMGKKTYCAYGYCYTYSLKGESLTFAQCLAAAAGLGGLNFLLFIVTTAVNGVALHNHRAQGLHSAYGQPATAPGAVGAAGVDAEKLGGAPAGGVVPLQPVAPVPVQDPYYEQQAAAQAQAAAAAQVQAGAQQPYYPSQQATPVDPNAAYYAQQQQAPQQIPQQVPAQQPYYEAAAPVQPVQPVQPQQ